MTNKLPQTVLIVNELLLRLSAFNADGISELFSEEIDWHVPGDPALPWVGHRSKRNEVADYFRTMWPHFVPGKSTTKPEKVVISGEDAVIFATFQHLAASTGRSWETPVALHLTIKEDKIVRLHLYEDTLAVSRAFFPSH